MEEDEFAPYFSEEPLPESMKNDLHVTYVSKEEFDRLLAWLDEPPTPNPKLVELFKKAKRYDTEEQG